MYKNLMQTVAVALAAFSFAACTETTDMGKDPKKVLNDYISHSFSVRTPSDRQVLLTYLARDAKSRLAAWSDEQFQEAFIDNKRQFVKLVFTETKPISSAETSITYELSYIDQGKGHDAKVTQKKLAQMILDQGKWQISDVRSIKEMVEYRNEMALP
jgi:predicted small secreted protein